MRITYFVERFWPYIGGLEVASAALLGELAARGHEVAVITDNASGRLPDRDSLGGVAVHRFDIAEPFRVGVGADVQRSRSAIARLRRRLRPDLVHAVFLGSAGCYAAATADAYPAPVLLAFHVMWPPLPAAQSAALRALVAGADWVTTCSHATLRMLLRDGVALPQTCSVITSASPLPDREPSPPTMDPPLLLYVGRLSPEKGVDVAIAAFASLQDRLPAARMLVVGDGPERPRLSAQAETLGVSGKVDFTGWVAPAAVPDLLARASIVVIPSRFEPFGLTAQEAAWAGRPIVASDTTGLAEQLVHGETALLVQPDDQAALADAIRALAGDPQRATALGRAARRAAERAQTVASYADCHEELYERLTARWRSVRGPSETHFARSLG